MRGRLEKNSGMISYLVILCCWWESYDITRKRVLHSNSHWLYMRYCTAIQNLVWYDIIGLVWFDMILLLVSVLSTIINDKNALCCSYSNQFFAALKTFLQCFGWIGSSDKTHCFLHCYQRIKQSTESVVTLWVWGCGCKVSTVWRQHNMSKFIKVWKNSNKNFLQGTFLDFD